MSRILDFYQDEYVRGLSDVLMQSDDAFERGHDFIQWMFPLPEPSKAQPLSPILTEADIEVFKTDEALRARVKESLARFLVFLKQTDRWLRPRDHNHLRITRVIRFLTLIEMPGWAQQVHDYVQVAPVNDQTRYYWREALNKNPAWL